MSTIFPRVEVPASEPGRATPAAPRAPDRPGQGGARALRWAATGWLGVALLGQIAFAVYVLALYGGGLVAGDLQRWNAVTPRAYQPGDAWGNVVFGSHVLFTVAVVFGGVLQLLPALRRSAPAVHRWNGRLYLLAAVVLATGGVAMMVLRGTVGSALQQTGTALNGVVIVLCAVMAWRHARARRIAEHRRWALRLFVAVSGVWFFRIGLMAWLLLHRAPVGFDPETFTGPFLVALAFAQFALPLAVLELLFHAQAPGAGRTLRLATAALLALLTLLTALGIAGATALMWWPRI
jgi:Predicted membrane protein (DUF2306)